MKTINLKNATLAVAKIEKLNAELYDTAYHESDVVALSTGWLPEIIKVLEVWGLEEVGCVTMKDYFQCYEPVKGEWVKFMYNFRGKLGSVEITSI